MQDINTNEKKNRLIGPINTDTIVIEGIRCTALIDSGSVISSVSKDFYDNYLRQIPLQSVETLFDGDLKISTTSGESLNLLGYLEVNVKLPGLRDNVSILVTVLATSILTERMPALIGSNVLEVWKLSLQEQHHNEPIPPVNSVVDSWMIDSDTIGHVTSEDYCNFMQPCSYINTRIKVPNTRPYDRKLVICPRSEYENLISSSTVIIPKHQRLVRFQLPTPMSKRRRIKIFAGTDIGTVCKIASVISLNTSNAANDSVDKETFLRSFGDQIESWPNQVKDNLCDLLYRHRNVFATHRHQLGKCTVSKHVIQLSDYSPIKSKYRRIPPNMYQAVRDELQQLTESGVIEPSYSPWSSPISIAVKSDGSPRICLDFRKVNALTKGDAQQIPNVEELMDTLQGKKIFSSLDLLQGYHQIELEEACREITAFNAGPLGFHQFTRMPFGLTNAGATFQRCMEYILKDYLTTFCMVYIDDIIIHDKTEQDHLRSLDAILGQLHQFGLRLKPNFFLMN